MYKATKLFLLTFLAIAMLMTLTGCKDGQQRDTGYPGGSGGGGHGGHSHFTGNDMTEQ